MIKKIFNTLLILFFFTISSCGDMKEGLFGKKNTSTDEFLVQKKDPLVFPPNFHELPRPNELNEEEEILDKDVKLSIKSIDTENHSSNSENYTNIEKYILEKIKNN